MDHDTTSEATNEIPYGYCHCGCGQKPTIAKQNSKKQGYIKGEPLKFVRGHHTKKMSLTPPEERITNIANGLKECASCQLWFPATTSHFHRHRSAPDGLRCVCITCRGFTKMTEYPAQEGCKICRKCKAEKPATLEYFYRQSKESRDGLGSHCKECVDSRKRQWNINNADKWKASLKAYGQRNKERKTKQSREWRKRNADHLREKRRQNKDKRKLQRKKYAAVSQKYMKAWRERNAERERQYYEQNKDAARARSRNYETRKLSLPSTLTAQDWQHALDYFGGCCAVCGRPPGLFHTLAMDHWVPISSPDCLGTVRENIVPLCHGQDGCNNEKSNRDASEWLQTKLGKIKARKTFARIADYFASLA